MGVQAEKNIFEESSDENGNSKEVTDGGDQKVGTDGDDSIGGTNGNDLKGGANGDDPKVETEEDDPKGGNNGDDPKGGTNGDDPKGGTEEDDSKGGTEENDPKGGTEEDDLKGGTNGDDPKVETEEDDPKGGTEEESPEVTPIEQPPVTEEEILENKVKKFKELYSSIENSTITHNKLDELKHDYIRIYDGKIKTEEFQKDIEEDRKRIEIAKKLYDFWTDKLDVLGDKYINDLIYDYRDEILDDFEGFKNGKKSLVIAIENNPQKNKEILSVTLKELIGKVDVMEKNSDIMSVKRVREDSGFMYLDSSNLDESEVQGLNGTLKSLLMIHKNLVSEKDGILSIDNQINNTIKQLYIPMKIESVTLDLINKRVKEILLGKTPSDDIIFKLVEDTKVDEYLVFQYLKVKDVDEFSNKDLSGLLNNDVDELIKDILTSDNSTSKSILEGVNKFQKSMVKFFNLSVIKAYNNITTTRKNFNKEHEGKIFLDKWNILFKDLEIYLLNFLKEFGITKIITNRSDDYNPEIHLPIAEAEKDEELKNDQVKSVENEGFQFSNRLIFEDAETSNHILKQAEVIVVRNN